MRVYYAPSATTVPTFFTPDDYPYHRPDEESFQSLIVTTENPEYYHITWAGSTPTLVRNTDADDVIEAKELEANAEAALEAQNGALRALETAHIREANNLPPITNESDTAALNSYVQLLQGDIDNPSSGVYNPPLPPGVTPPPHKSFTVTVTREPGWNAALGFKVELNSTDEDFTPGQMALAVYTNADCQDYEYTTGAFVLTGEIWGAVCPAGFEPGDTDIHFGILYGAAPMTCWTMPQGQTVQTITTFEET